MVSLLKSDSKITINTKNNSGTTTVYTFTPSYSNRILYYGDVTQNTYETIGNKINTGAIAGSGILNSKLTLTLKYLYKVQDKYDNGYAASGKNYLYYAFKYCTLYQEKVFKKY